MEGTEIRDVELEAYRRARASLSAMLDNLTGRAPRSIATALYEQQPPSILSPHDPVLGHYAWLLIDARGAAGDDYYIPKIAMITAKTIAMAYGRDSTEFGAATAIIRTAHLNRAARLRPALSRAYKRVARRRDRHGEGHLRTIRAGHRLRRLQLRSGQPDAAARDVESAITDLQLINPDIPALAVVSRFLSAANDFAEFGELDRAVTLAERANSWLTEHDVPAAQRPELTAMYAGLGLFDHCLAAGRADRCGEVAATLAGVLAAHAEPEFVAEHTADVNAARGRAALLNHDHAGAARHLPRALFDPPVPLPSLRRRLVRNDLVFAMAVPEADR